MELRELWLILHVIGAIAAFGFGFTAPIFGSMVANEPHHGNWYLRSVKRVSNIIIVPAALSLLVTGVLLVMATGGFGMFQQLWLALALVIYIVAMTFVFAVQRPTLDRVIELTSGPPGPDGPPPEVPALVGRLRLIGIGLTIAVIVIIYLMVAKPVL